MGFWENFTSRKRDEQRFEDLSDEDFLHFLANAHFDALEAGLEPDFHAEVILKSSLVLPSIRDAVPIKSWYFKIQTNSEPTSRRSEGVVELVKSIDSQLNDKGLLPDRALRNIELLRGGYLEKWKTARETSDDMHLFGRVEKREFASALNIRDKLIVTSVFELNSEMQFDEENNYTGERFEVHCTHLNHEFDLFVTMNVSDVPHNVRKLSLVEFDLCHEGTLLENRAYLLGPGWDVFVYGLPDCCRGIFDQFLTALHAAMGGELLRLPQ